MKCYVFVVLVVLFAVAIEARRQKRNLLQFGLMITQATGRSPFDYNNYGCFCGVGGKGRPRDGVDRCCKAHDACYTAVTKMGCNSYFLTYEFSVDDNTDAIICNSDDSDCEQALCRCDKVAVECFARNKYNSKLKGKC